VTHGHRRRGRRRTLGADLRRERLGDRGMNRRARAGHRLAPRAQPRHHLVGRHSELVGDLVDPDFSDGVFHFLSSSPVIPPTRALTGEPRACRSVPTMDRRPSPSSGIAMPRGARLASRSGHDRRHRRTHRSSGRSRPPPLVECLAGVRL